jgi:hypothetical protein
VQAVAQVFPPVEANEHQIRDETLVATHRFLNALTILPPAVEWSRMLCGLATKGEFGAWNGRFRKTNSMG